MNPMCSPARMNITGVNLYKSFDGIKIDKNVEINAPWLIGWFVKQGYKLSYNDDDGFFIRDIELGDIIVQLSVISEWSPETIYQLAPIGQEVIKKKRLKFEKRKAIEAQICDTTINRQLIIQEIEDLVETTFLQTKDLIMEANNGTPTDLY